MNAFLSRRFWRSQKPPPTSVKALVKKRRPSILFCLALLLLTGTIGYRYYNEPQLSVGRLAPETILAPNTAARVEDSLATVSARKAARQNTLRVVVINSVTNQEIQTDLQQRLIQVDQLRQKIGPFPYLSTQLLTEDVQQTLRHLNNAQWKTLSKTLQRSDRPQPIPTEFRPPGRFNAWTQVQAYYLQNRKSPEAAKFLQTIQTAQQRYQSAQSEITTLSSLDTAPLLTLNESDWQAAQKQLPIILKRMLTQGIAPGLRADMYREAVASQVADLPKSQQKAIQILLPSLLRPNITEDPTATLQQQEQAAQQIEPVFVSIRRGETIVQAGEKISSKQFALLDYFGLSRRNVNWVGLLGTFALVFGGVSLVAFAQSRQHPPLSRRDRLLVLLLALSTPLMIGLTEVQYASLPLTGVLVGSFYGSRLGALVVILLSTIIPVGLGAVGWEWVSLAVGSLTGSVMAGQARSREELAKIGVILGLTVALLYGLALASNGEGVYLTVRLAAKMGLLGLGWCIAALGISPYLENVFDLVTTIRLAELANPNRPLLKRLAEQAPGTFQHTLFVASLAEAGARALNCNVELVRTGTLYHDIGKLHDPQAFIENQFGGPNKHTQIDNPWKSADIIRRHVTEGIVMARRAGLPTAVRAFIPEHQGSMLIAYFYHQAQQLAEAEPGKLSLREEDFRYAGPIPQSRETGIVMLADSCEAAMRSLNQSEPAIALKTIKQIFKARWQDQQLTDAKLSREELETLAQVFVEVWQQANHQRIAYPKNLVFPVPKKSRAREKASHSKRFQ
jgi:cyclic-di-AMP phosphodiesterase PgpH